MLASTAALSTVLLESVLQIAVWVFAFLQDSLLVFLTLFLLDPLLQEGFILPGPLLGWGNVLGILP